MVDCCARRLCRIPGTPFPPVGACAITPFGSPSERSGRRHNPPLSTTALGDPKSLRYHQSADGKSHSGVPQKQGCGPGFTVVSLWQNLDRIVIPPRCTTSSKDGRLLIPRHSIFSKCLLISGYCSQSSIFNLGIRENSLVLCVTNTIPLVLACPASNTS